MSLAGVWATNRAYGFEILSVYKEMLDWALSGEEQATGLVPPVPPPVFAKTPAAGSSTAAPPAH
jgi:hypothetical protein